MEFYKRNDINLTGGPQDAEYLYSRYGVEAPCWHVMRRYSDGRLINISDNNLHNHWTIVDVPLVRDKVIAEGAVPQHSPDIDKLREQAEGWEAVYKLCLSLGMDQTQPIQSGREQVLGFIKRLYETCELQSGSLDKAANQLRRREQVHDRTIARWSRLRCIVDQLHREMNLD